MVFWQTFVSSARREASRLRASPWDLAMISWVPMLGCLLFGWIFSAGLPQNLPIAVIDQDHSGLSRQLQRFRTAMDASGDGVFLVSRDQLTGAFSQHVRELLGVVLSRLDDVQVGTQIGR